MGNWGNFVGVDVRDVLIVRVDPGRVSAVMPTMMMVGYGVGDTRQTARDFGVHIVGTRHPQRLVQTLDKAMPSRRTTE